MKYSAGNEWKQLSDDASYAVILEITELCNDVQELLLRRMRRSNIKTKLRKEIFQNLQNQPEFVPFQQNRTHDHKNFRHYKQRRKKDGNQPGEHPAAKPNRLQLPSVHKMLTEYHRWLPRMSGGARR